MKVKNINGTSDSMCKCGSWLKHWEKFSEWRIPDYCAEEKCIQKPEAGAHIQKNITFDDTWYIIPLCETHNAKKGESINIMDSIKLVPANKNITCEKP